ncbi:hypothetical protein B0H14DRAFT_2613401 [Mycena olivaceomarginata]|nr:hypothetical protein B0H14DRAFT_2613401 [Mycena olivaceomarginata]
MCDEHVMWLCLPPLPCATHHLGIIYPVVPTRFNPIWKLSLLSSGSCPGLEGTHQGTLWQDGEFVGSGKEFSAYDLAIGAAVSPPQYFSVADCLKQRLEAQQFTQILDEPQAPATKLNSKKLGSKRRKRERRELDASQAQDPGLKAIHRERRAAAKKNALQTDFDAIDLPHSTPSWIGKRPQCRHLANLFCSGNRDGESRLHQEELNRMSGTDGFTYIDWLGELTIPIIDSHRRLIALLGGKPKDLLGWKKVTDSAAHLMESLSPAPISPHPANSANHPDNIEITDEMLEHECFSTHCRLRQLPVPYLRPDPVAFYQAQMALLAAWNSALNSSYASLQAQPSLSPQRSIRHSNIPVQPHEKQFSFVQYTAGGLFRWIRNGYMTDEDFLKKSTMEVEGGSGRGGRDALGRGTIQFLLINLYERRLEPILVIGLIANTLRMYRPLRRAPP